MDAQKFTQKSLEAIPFRQDIDFDSPLPHQYRLRSTASRLRNNHYIL